MKKRILSVLISGVLLFGTVFANAVSISFEDLKQNNDESSIYFEDLEQSDKTSDLEETQIPESKNTEIVSENNILEANEAGSYIDEYYFPEATDESIQTLSLDSYNVMTLNDSETIHGYTFVKWNRSGTNGTMTSLTGSSTYTFGASNGTTDTLTAEWKANNYTVTYIDVIDSKTGRELGRSTASKPYNSTARGSDKGSSKTDNAYYNGYYYDSDTSATVTTSGATVYRIFKQRMNTIAGNIIWEDWNNKNLSRPGNVNLYIKGSDGKTYSYVITGNHSQNTSVNRWPYSYNLPKYDSNGMDSVESERIECLNRLQAVQEQQLNEKKIYQMLLEFDRIYDKLSMDEQRSVLQSLISEVQIYKKDEIKESKTYIKKIKFAFDIENIGEILDNKGNHVETVCLLSRKKQVANPLKISRE